MAKEKEQFHQNKLIDEVLNFLYPSILDGKVKIKKENVGEVTLYGYADEIRQVFINIIFNAIDVLNHNRISNPTIEIKSFIENNTHVVISISIMVRMIPAELSKTIFEPFFTTKKLGTVLVYSFVKKL